MMFAFFSMGMNMPGMQAPMPSPGMGNSAGVDLADLDFLSSELDLGSSNGGLGSGGDMYNGDVAMSQGM